MAQNFKILEDPFGERHRHTSIFYFLILTQEEILSSVEWQFARENSQAVGAPSRYAVYLLLSSLITSLLAGA